MFNQKQLMKLQKELAEKMARMQEDMEKRTAEGSAGGGMVKVVANGHQQIVSVKIEKEAMDSNDVEMLQDLIVAAVNNALDKIREMNQDDLSQLTGGLDMGKFPGMPKLF